ncbi:hypothetical protein JNUCC1_02689 [Lentibacillus sp. JNUCC-1]|uniref:immunity 22 family protein n=1 Tax=Lentibacillus sp. JNUCC-1 TaxID=2654513 RepID=UPI0012E9640A|nr:immunity 22 family protein [Lentibacillus sp. JNUCC-1]MUV38818.1 hypothetical protein [Lentibacillus sp. JNUCC-1]
MTSYVSLWLGVFPDFEAVDQYMEVKYTEDGDSIPSDFEKDSRLGYYDRVTVEKDWMPDAGDEITKMLAGFSYDDQIISQFMGSKVTSRYNTMILVYGYNYYDESSVINSIDSKSYKIDYIGNAAYKHE